MSKTLRLSDKAIDDLSAVRTMLQATWRRTRREATHTGNRGRHPAPAAAPLPTCPWRSAGNQANGDRRVAGQFECPQRVDSGWIPDLEQRGIQAVFERTLAARTVAVAGFIGVDLAKTGELA